MQGKLHKLKKFSRTMVGKMTIFGIIAVLVGANLGPILMARAAQHGEGEYGLRVDIDDPDGWMSEVTVNANEWQSAEDEYLTGNGKYFLTATLIIPDADVKQTTSIRTGGDKSENFEVRLAGTPEHLADDTTKFTYTMNYTNMVEHDFLSLMPYSEDGGGEPGPGPEPEGDTEAIVRLRGGEGSFDDSVYDEDGNLIEERTVYYADTYYEGAYAINGGHFYQMAPEDQVDGTGYSEASYMYNDDGRDTVTLGFASLWHMRYVDSIVVNNVNYNIEMDYDDQVSYLNHYGGQIVSFEIEVPKANDNFYDVVIKLGRNEHPWIGNFLWTADPEQQYERDCHWDDETGTDVCEIRYDEEGNPIPGRDYVGHSTLDLIAVQYTLGNEIDGYTTYSCDKNTMLCSQWESDKDGNMLPDAGGMGCSLDMDENCSISYLEFESHSDGMVDGSLVVPAGARVTMRVIPDYGYQVVNVNMAELEVSDDGIGEFTFTVSEGAAYFVADVVEAGDFVNAETDLVTDGSIDLGEGQTTLSHGSARLDVKDVDLTDEDIAGFEGAAEGYEIKNYLNISLFNVTCKGAEVCIGSDEDSWTEQVKDLNEPATITLQLEEGVDGNEIVIVHQKHDGTYEIIPTVYDAETNTITFTTASFSNYAIASRTVDAEPEDESAMSTPDTGLFTALSEGASVGVAGVLLVVLGVGAFVLKRRDAKK